LIPCVGSMLLTIVIYLGCLAAVVLHKRKQAI